MCIRDSAPPAQGLARPVLAVKAALAISCLLYTSDAADDTPCVDLGGRRIIKKQQPPAVSYTHLT
ncbi:hypothetical protein, partial [Staphylococcus aureus]